MWVGCWLPIWFHKPDHIGSIPIPATKCNFPDSEQNYEQKYERKYYDKFRIKKICIRKSY